jgi:3-oxoadipate enol-lactonase
MFTSMRCKRVDVTSRLSELAGIPVLVLSAARDILRPPACGRKLAAGIPGARYVGIADTAHGVTIQAPEIVSQLLSDHSKSARA